MPSTHRHSYDLNFKLKIVAETKAVNNNREICLQIRLIGFEFETDSEAEDDE